MSRVHAVVCGLALAKGVIAWAATDACDAAGPKLTAKEAVKFFKTGEISAALGELRENGIRARKCNPLTGCGDWMKVSGPLVTAVPKFSKTPFSNQTFSLVIRKARVHVRFPGVVCELPEDSIGGLDCSKESKEERYEVLQSFDSTKPIPLDPGMKRPDYERLVVLLAMEIEESLARNWLVFSLYPRCATAELSVRSKADQAGTYFEFVGRLERRFSGPS